MADVHGLKERSTAGWRTGFHNLLRTELKRWWSTRRWLLQTLMWIVIIDGLLGLIGVVSLMSAELDVGAADIRQVFGLIAVLSAIGVTVLMQNVIINEKENGVAGWILSKPVSRPAYILSKLLGHASGILVCVVWIPGLIAYLEFSLLYAGEWLPFLNYLGALGLVSLEVLFYLCLTLMLGTIFTARGAVLAVPLALIFGQQAMIGVVKALIYVLPYTLSTASAGAVLYGESIPFLFPVFATGGWCVIFVGLALWRFQREEF